MMNRTSVLSFQVAAIICPILSIGVFQMVMAEPSKAKAQNGNAEFLPLPAVPDWSAQSGSAERLYQAVSPLWFEEIEMQLPVMPVVTRPEQQTELEPDPIFVLSAVLPSAKNSLAMINGKPNSVGDEVATGWTLMKISGKDRYVILRHTSGRRMRVLLTRN